MIPCCFWYSTDQVLPLICDSSVITHCRVGPPRVEHCMLEEVLPVVGKGTKMGICTDKRV